MPDEPSTVVAPQEPVKPKKPKVELPTSATDLVPSHTIKLGNTTVEVTPQGLERFLADNDVSQLAGNAETRVMYYSEMCKRFDVDPFTKPFDWIPSERGLILYPNKEFAAQRRKKSGISCRVVEEGVRGPSNGQPGPEVYFVRMQGEVPAQAVPVETLVAVLSAQPSREELIRWGRSLVELARKTTGRVDEEIGAVPFSDAMGRPLDPASKTNAMKRAYTQAHRRVTLSLEGCGADDPAGAEDHSRSNTPAQPRVLTPPTRVRQLPKAPDQPAEPSVAPEGKEGPSEGILEATAEVVQQPQPPEPPKPTPSVAPRPQQQAGQPAPAAPPTAAPKVTTVGTRKVYVPQR